MNESFLISVIIPLYNAQAYVTEAVNSVLAQSYPAMEIIIIDDGSTDQSLSIARALEPQVKVYTQSNQGPAAARNLGVSFAKGNILAFLDADDLWDEQKLQKQINVFCQNSDADMVFGHVQQFNEGSMPNVHDSRVVLPGLFHTCMMIRKDKYMQVGALETKWQFGEFFDWYARAQDLGLKSIMIPDIVAKRRIHGGNLGIRKKEAYSDYLKAVRTILKRRRDTLTV